LAGLNTILTEVDGVIDGAFFQPRRHEVEGVSRLVAIVVAPQANARAIREALRLHLDPAFLPRRILHVDRLPRSATGKLTYDALLELVRGLGLEAPC
jgi:acyl-coenzyme A synthetase/AMP-(fatty) acid ligase